MIERLLVDETLRDRLVAEASEHVLSFDWDDIAQRTHAIYSELAPRQTLRLQPHQTSRVQGAKRG
jgi:glycogen(starch) synthase